MVIVSANEAFVPEEGMAVSIIDDRSSAGFRITRLPDGFHTVAAAMRLPKRARPHSTGSPGHCQTPLNRPIRRFVTGAGAIPENSIRILLIFHFPWSE